MESNPAYGFVQQSISSETPTTDNTYELVNLPATNEACADHSKMNTAGDHEIPKVDKPPQGRSIIGVIVAVLALVVAFAAITATVVLSQTDNSNQEIKTLQLEIEKLREMLNQTGDNSNQEIQSLQLEIKNLREMLNQTGDSLAIQVSTLKNENQEQDRKYILSIEYTSCEFTHDKYLQ